MCETFRPVYLLKIVFYLIASCSQELMGYSSVLVDVTNNTGHIKNFWNNTGFSPPSGTTDVSQYLLSKDVKLNLALISSIPNNGLRNVRIHWLLDLLQLKSPKGVCCDFSKLDEILDWMVFIGLKPGFEIMGNPSNIFQKKDSAVFQKWKRIIRETIHRCISRYGVAEVSQWRFETWNEPDLKMYNNVNFTLQEYLTYVSETIHAVRSLPVSLQLKLGGPAGLFKERSKHPLCWGFLEYCNNNSLLCDLDFLSFHKKGNGSSDKVVEESFRVKNEISKMFPKLKQVPFVNDESDILSGWWRPESWRGDVNYAAAVSKVIYLFQSANESDRIQWISNDNAFLNIHPYFFSQRTLLARFVMNSTNERHVQVFRKPIFSVMALLALIEGVQVNVQSNDSRISVLASKETTCEKCFCSSNTLIIASNDPLENLVEKKFVVDLEYIFPAGCKISALYAIYSLSNSLPHPKNVWEEMGQPEFPDKDTRRKMRKSEGPHRLRFGEVSISGNMTNFKINVALPSVTLIQICSDKVESPGQTVGLKAVNITFNEVLLFWNDKYVLSRCIKTYELQFCEYPCKTQHFKRINRADTIMLSFHHAGVNGKDPYESVRGRYKVFAVDYWGRAGESSNELIYL